MKSQDFSTKTDLAALSLGFRDRYLPYEALTQQVKAWAEAFPDVVRLESLGTTPEGRSLWLLIIGREPNRLRPAAWVDGNMHACELAGSSVALSIAEDAIRCHLEPDKPLHDLPEHLMQIVREDVLLYVLPRISPDGAERVLSTGAWVRSNPRDQRLGRSAPYWRHADVDGDGQVRMMRHEDPAGDFVQSSEVPNWMLPRRIEDKGPYYTLYPEGVIENWDGFTVPMPDYMSDSETDMNRNFPFDWAPEGKQKGSGAFPTSEPESRAVTEFAVRHPNIFAWANLHTFGGVYIRPSAFLTDKQMNQSDLELFRQLEEWGKAACGYPMVSSFEEFTYEPDTPLRGDLSTFAYEQLGAIGFVCELWDFFHQVGLTIHRPFVWNYAHRTREDLIKMALWDREHNQGRIVGSWRSVQHAQLGAVEVGGYDPRFGIWNPPPERLSEVCSQQARFFFRLAALGPRLRLSAVETRSVGDGFVRITAVVENLGYLPTYVLSSAKALPVADPVRAYLTVEEGDVVVVSGQSPQTVGHLGGWGGYEKTSLPPLGMTSGAPIRGRIEWVVRGQGRVTIRAGSARTGHVQIRLET